MNSRRNLYISAFVGASISFIFNAIAFAGTFKVFRWFVFVIIFLGLCTGLRS